jgi:hypothetical protein
MTGIIAVVALTDLDLYQDHVVKRNAGKHRQAAQVMKEDLSCPPTRRRSERSRLDSQRSKPACYVLPYTHLP